jgi:hypothetical protein
MSETNKTCKTCEHCIGAEFNSSYKFCDLLSRESGKMMHVTFKNAACEHYVENRQMMTADEKVKRIIEKLNKLDEDFDLKKVELEDYYRQRNLLNNKLNGATATRDKCDYSMIINI